MDVLIVSRDDACGKSLAEVLGAAGYAVETAVTIGDAQSRLDATTGAEMPASIVIDVDSAESRPQRFLARLRARHPHGVVFVTGTDADAALLTDLIHLGIRDYIPKPFDPGAFASILGEAGGFVGGARADIQEPGGSSRAASETAAELVRANEQLKILNNSLRQHVSQLTILYQMGRDISENENWSDALDRFLMALVNYTNADGAALLLFSRSETRLAPRSNFQVDTGRLHDACETLLSQWRDNPRGGEIHSIESYDDRVFSTCLERLKPWKYTVVPLRHRNRSLGFLFIEKLYRSGRRFKADYLFLNTIQTILAEEVANASYISELRQLGRFNRKVLENINSGVITTDLDGYVAYFNQLAGRLCPHLPGSGQDRIHFNLLFRCRDFGDDFFRGIIESGEDTHLLEIDCTGDGSRTFPARLSISKMYDDNLNGDVLVGIFDDLTDQKNMQAEIRRHDRLRVLGQLSAGVAHEIRNPLTGIATTAELLGSKIKDEAKTKYVRAILDETNRLDEIIKNLLNFARPAKPRMGICALSDISKRVINLLSEEAGKKRIELELKDEATNDVCTADPNQLTQVLLNIVLNGIQACDEGNRIEIRVSNEEVGGAPGTGFTRVEISDDGRGVPEEIRESLFEPFVTTKTYGTGLGLAISQQIVEEHRGTIECDFLATGTRFTIRLPAREKARVLGGRLTRSSGER